MRLIKITNAILDETYFYSEETLCKIGKNEAINYNGCYYKYTNKDQELVKKASWKYLTNDYYL